MWFVVDLSMLVAEETPPALDSVYLLFVQRLARWRARHMAAEAARAGGGRVTTQRENEPAVVCCVCWNCARSFLPLLSFPCDPLSTRRRRPSLASHGQQRPHATSLPGALSLMIASGHLHCTVAQPRRIKCSNRSTCARSARRLPQTRAFPS